MKLYGKDVLSKECGWITNDRVVINMSSIYTKLIQMAGRWCEYYASDILYDIKNIEEHIRQMEFPDDILIGFRQMGVDSGKMFDCRAKKEPDIYRKILKITFERKTENMVEIKLIEMH